MTLTEIEELLQETGAAIARMEPFLRERQNNASLLISLQSLRKRQEQLEEELLDTADRLGQDVCCYRLLSEDSARPTVSAFSRALEDFQHLFSVIYDAVKNGPKERAKLSAGVSKETAFGFGYTFPGSIGAVFTLPNERLLPSLKTHIDTAMDNLSRMARATDAGEIASLAKEIGRPSVRAAYTWAKDHVFYGLGASIEWRRGRNVPLSLLIQQPELARLQRTIASSSEETEEEVSVRGVLEGADIRSRTFRISLPTGGDVRGWFRDAISETHVVTLPQRYTAILKKTTRIVYSTETEETSYFLVRLESV